MQRGCLILMAVLRGFGVCGGCLDLLAVSWSVHSVPTPSASTLNLFFPNHARAWPLVVLACSPSLGPLRSHNVWNLGGAIRHLPVRVPDFISSLAMSPCNTMFECLVCEWRLSLSVSAPHFKANSSHKSWQLCCYDSLFSVFELCRSLSQALSSFLTLKRG